MGKQSQPAPAENWSSEHWGQEAWDETAWNESGWAEGDWREPAAAQPRVSNSSAGRLFSEEGKDQNRSKTLSTASAPGFPSDDKELVTVDKLKSLLPMMMDLHLERHNQMSTKLRNEDDESVISKDKEREATRPYVRHRDNGFGLLYAQQAQKNQDLMVSETSYAPPSSILKVSGLGTDRPATMYRKDLPERIYIDLM